MPARLAVFALLLSTLVACGQDTPAPTERTEAPATVDDARDAMLDHLEKELERVDRKSPPPLTLSGEPGDGRIGIGYGTGGSDESNEDADDK
ncbi:MAG: hypothetical protein QNJ98_07135 [Planctomycetota bacterium]|nr:hypothetical protein [Planctomycetota bacterium]